MTDELHIYAYLVQQVLQERHLGRKAQHLVCAAVIGTHIDLVGCRCQVIRAITRRLRPGDDGLSALPELREGCTKLLQGGDASGGRIRT